MTRNPIATDGLSELKAHFLAGLNHEIRTPLTGILGMLDLLMETDLTEEQRDYAESSHLCAENLLEIMNSTLEFSALSANQITLEVAEFPLREMLEGLLDEFGFKANAKGLTLVRKLSTDLPELVIGDALRLKQLLSQLIGNAIKFTNQGEVELSASAFTLVDGEAFVSIEVRDTGIGIPPDKLHTIFDSFRQVETGLARRYTGMGLGLAVAQKLAKLMSAEVSVTSKPGHGSTFSVHLPFRVPRELSRRSLAAGQPALFRILVVDDSTVAETVAVHVLHCRSYQVDCASSSEEAAELAARNHYDLILIDPQMAGQDGLSVSDAIRRLPAYRETPMVATTTNGSPEDRNLCAQRGLQGLLRKPVQSGDLLRTIEQYLPVQRIAV